MSNTSRTDARGRASDAPRVTVSFAAIDPFIQEQIIAPTEKRMTGRDIVSWGERNNYPDYILELIENVPTLDSIIEGCTDYITGDRQTLSAEVHTSTPAPEWVPALVRALARDYESFGGCAIQVIRAADGSVASIHHLDIRFVRSNKDNTVFYYSEDWKKPGSAIVYQAFMPDVQERWPLLSDAERDEHASTVLYIKNDGRHTYPRPPFAAAVKAAEMERGIDTFHLSALENGFTSSAIVNFNNGQPTDEVKEEIEENFNQKNAGAANAGRVILSWNDNKDSATTIEEFKVEDFGEKYKSLASRARQQLFTAFRANPNLFGIPTENLGFSNEEYESAFRLFNRTHVRPIQRIICDAFDRIFGIPGVLTITPFSIDGDAEQNVN